MSKLRLALLVLAVAAALGAQPPSAFAQAGAFCRPGEVPAFTFGFAALKAQLGPTMGDPVECAHPNPANGDVLQQTTTGLSFWRKSTNTPTFTNGYEHWGLTPGGLVSWAGDSVDPPVTSVAGTLQGSPESAVRTYYGAIGARDFPAAWALLSPRQRAALEYGTWVDGHRNTRAVQTPSVTTVGQSGDTATVDVTVVAIDAEGASAVIKTFRGTWGLVVVEGGWKLDAPRIALVDEQRSTAARPTTAPASVSQPTPAQPSPMPPISPPSTTAAGNCHPSYPDFCVPPPPPDLDCTSSLIAGRTNFTVLPPDPHRFDADHDGVGCEPRR
jgi:hypothetical protein